MEIQIVSDLHAEFWSAKSKFNFLTPSAPILALLGDICCCGSDEDFKVFKRFIEEIVPMYEHIIYITGNHEYYFNPNKKSAPNADITMTGINKKIKELFKNTSPKLHFLNNSTMKLTTNKQTYLIVGTTLWTWIPLEHRSNIQKSMNDYQFIYVEDGKSIRKITSDDVANMHLKNTKFIRGQIAKAKKEGYKVVVLTHHKPYTSKAHDPSSLDSAYASDLVKLFQPPVVLWGYGHTHVSDNFVKGSTRVYSNPKGYPNQRTKFKKNECVKV